MTDGTSDPDTGDGGMAAMVAGILAVALVAVAAFYIFNLNRMSADMAESGPVLTVSDEAAPAK
jgi:hypothetical protein